MLLASKLNLLLLVCDWLCARVAFLAFVSKFSVGSNFNGRSIASLTVDNDANEPCHEAVTGSVTGAVFR